MTATAGRMTLWDLATNKAIWEMERSASFVRSCPQLVILSQSANPASGRSISSRPAPASRREPCLCPAWRGDKVSAIAFHPGKQFFAAITRRLDGGDLRIVGLDDGEVKTKFRLPVSAACSLLQWVGDDYLLLDGTALISVNRECVVWNYQLPDGMHLRDSPDQRHWYIAADPARANVYTVRGVDMRDAGVVQRIGAAELRGKTLLEPGGMLELDVEVTDPATPDFATKVKNILTDRYQGAKIKVSLGAEIKLIVRDRVEGGYRLELSRERANLFGITTSKGTTPRSS